MDEARNKAIPTAVSLLATAALCAVCFHAGARFNSVTPNGKYLLADKDAVILSAVMERGSTDPEALNAEVVRPIVKKMQYYTEQGYVIIDGGKDERGNYSVAAVPADTRDITQELEAVVAKEGSAK